MHPEPINTSYLITHAGRLAPRVLTRDNLHLSPDWLSNAAAARLRQGLRHLEAFLRRVLILMALALEPGLKPNLRVYVKPQTKPLKIRKRHAGFRLLRLETPTPDWGDFPSKNNDKPRARPPPLPPVPRRDALKIHLANSEMRGKYFKNGA